MWYICLYESFPPDRFPGIVVYLFLQIQTNCYIWKLNKCGYFMHNGLLGKSESKTEKDCVCVRVMQP